MIEKKEGAEHETNWKSGSGLRRATQDVLQVGSEKVCVHVGTAGGIRFTQRGMMMTPIQRIVHDCKNSSGRVTPKSFARWQRMG